MVTHGLQTGESVIPFCLQIGHGRVEAALRGGPEALPQMDNQGRAIVLSPIYLKFSIYQGTDTRFNVIRGAFATPVLSEAEG